METCYFCDTKFDRDERYKAHLGRCYTCNNQNVCKDGGQRFCGKCTNYLFTEKSEFQIATLVYCVKNDVQPDLSLDFEDRVMDLINKVHTDPDVKAGVIADVL